MGKARCHSKCNQKTDFCHWRIVWRPFVALCSRSEASLRLRQRNLRQCHIRCAPAGYSHRDQISVRQCVDQQRQGVVMLGVSCSTKNRLALVIWLSRIPRRLLMGFVHAYRILLSPWLGTSCRFEPTCSSYALQALGNRGAVMGSYLTLHRLVRCNPWCDGGHDPLIPAQQATSPSLFSSLTGRLTSPSSSEKTSS